MRWGYFLKSVNISYEGSQRQLKLLADFSPELLRDFIIIMPSRRNATMPTIKRRSFSELEKKKEMLLENINLYWKPHIGAQGGWWSGRKMAIWGMDDKRESRDCRLPAE